MRRLLVRLAVILGAALIMLVIVFVAWGSTPMGPLPEAEQALLSDDSVRVVQADWLVFEPVGSRPDTGLIFYPGARVDYRSYAPLARAIAAQGFRVVIVPMPLNLAVFGANRAGEVITGSPEIRHWAIGGHSLGGSMAALYAAQNPGAAQGLVLLASFPAENSSLAATGIDVVSIYGTQDGLTTGEMISRSLELLPSSTRYVVIEGGNHAQFGRYGKQNGDGQATITAEEQQEQTVLAAVELLKNLGGQ